MPTIPEIEGAPAMGYGYGSAGYDPLSQGPLHLPTLAPPPGDPPGYWRGWPLANPVKRVISAVIDWGPLGALALVSVHLSTATQEGSAQVSYSTWRTIGWAWFFTWLAGIYNTLVRQSRTGQSWGKTIVGLRLVRMHDFRPPSKLALFFRPWIQAMEIFSLAGSGLVVMLATKRRQLIADKVNSTVVLGERKAGQVLEWARAGPMQTNPARPASPGACPLIIGWRRS